MKTPRERQEEIYQDLLAQANGKNIVSVPEASQLTGKSWSTIDRAIKARHLRASQHKKHGKRTVFVRDLAKWVDGDFDF